MQEIPSDLITQSEAARLRGVTPEAIADLIKRKRLDAYDVAGRLHVRRSDILKFKNKKGGRPAKLKPRAAKKKGSRRDAKK